MLQRWAQVDTVMDKDGRTGKMDNPAGFDRDLRIIVTDYMTDPEAIDLSRHLAELSAEYNLHIDDVCVAFDDMHDLYLEGWGDYKV